jgi:hypothetical protein
MSKLEVIAVAILASPVLLHLLKRFLPLKPEHKQAVTNIFNGPVYIGTMPLGSTETLVEAEKRERAPIVSRVDDGITIPSSERIEFKLSSPKKSCLNVGN